MDETARDTTGIIDQKRAEHASVLGVDEGQVRTYVLDLQWMLSHGTLVDIDVHGATMFNSRASLMELGIPAGDTRAARLRPGTRELIDDHLTAHVVDVETSTVYLGFEPELGASPAFYCAKASNIAEVEVLLETTHGHEVWEALNSVAIGEDASRWVNIPDYLLDDDGWEPAEYNGQRLRWLRVTFDTDRITQGDFICNPLKAFRSLEVRFRQSLDRYGNSFEGFGGYKWIGFKAYEAWRTEWDRMQAEWAAVKAYVLWRYDEFMEALEADFSKIAAEAWQAMAARHPNGFVCLVGDNPVESQEVFVDIIVRRAQDRMPARERIERDLYVDYRPALLLGQETVKADLLAAEKLQTEIEAELVQQRVERARLESERMQLVAMREAEMEKARQLMANTVSPYQEMFDLLRTEMNAGAIQVLESLRKNQGLRGKVADKARNMAELFRLMNSHDDRDMEALIAQLEARLPAEGGTSKDASAQNQVIGDALEEIVEFTRQSAFDVAHREASAYGFDALEL
jgi:hypothetical protein